MLATRESAKDCLKRISLCTMIWCWCSLLHGHWVMLSIRYFLHLSLYLLQITILGNAAFAIGSVEDVRLVATVDVVNCFTVLGKVLTTKQDHVRMNVAPDLNNHLRSIYLFRSMIIRIRAGGPLLDPFGTTKYGPVRSNKAPKPLELTILVVIWPYLALFWYLAECAKYGWIVEWGNPEKIIQNVVHTR